MTLITSAAYVNSEFQVEFGRIPPAFLPVGNKKLIQHQVLAIRNTFKSEAVFLTLPDSYQLNKFETRVLNDCKIFVIKCKDSLSLGGSIKFALKYILKKTKEESVGLIRLLHGDTLVPGFPKKLNFIGISKLKDDYHWEVDRIDELDDSIWCGCFAFGSLKHLLANLEYNENFVDAIRAIDTKKCLERIRIDNWMDFGHINTYFQSRSQLTTQRSFNALVVSGGCVRKTGQPSSKIIAESKWFKDLPVSFKCFSPQLIDCGNGADDKPYYVTEYLPIPPLNEIFVHGRNSAVFWQRVIRLCFEYLEKCLDHPLSGSASRRVELEFIRLARDKTLSRLELFAEQNSWFEADKPIKFNQVNLPSVRKIAEECINCVKNEPAMPGLLHGDFCFSNILYDSRSGMIKVIDPRGLNSDGKITNLGDVRYDMAKLTHSVIGLYDFIIAGAFDCKLYKSSGSQEMELSVYKDERIQSVQNEFLQNRFGNRLSTGNALPMTVLLFFSMLPLHNDNHQRQIALLANGCRIYSEFTKYML
jgi:hypothetical protein